MSTASINRHNVGRIAERIVSNELEYRGFRVSDLNKEGISANADLIAVKDGKTWQIQVKGATWDKSPWVNYSHCKADLISGKIKVFNGADSKFYRAQIVVLVCVKSPSEYTCVILPTEMAEKAAQLNLNYSYRNLRLNGSPKQPTGPIWASIGYVPKKLRDESKRPAMEAGSSAFVLECATVKLFASPRAASAGNTFVVTARRSTCIHVSLQSTRPGFNGYGAGKVGSVWP
jgi:hypothetical protein